METVAGSPGYKKQFPWQGNAVHHSKPGLLGFALAEQAAGGSCYRGIKMVVSGGEGLFTFWRNESAFCFSWFLSVERNKSVCAVSCPSGCSPGFGGSDMGRSPQLSFCTSIKVSVKKIWELQHPWGISSPSIAGGRGTACTYSVASPSVGPWLLCAIRNPLSAALGLSSSAAELSGRP